MEPAHVHLLHTSSELPVGQTNVYFIEGAFPTLVDTPLKGGVHVRELETALNDLGYSIRDIKRIVVTHPHFDHFGAAAEIVDVSGAEVWTSRGGAKTLEYFQEEFERDMEYYGTIMQNSGAPGEPRVYLDDLRSWAGKYGCPVPVSRLLDDGDVVELGSSPYLVRAVPGHSPWCILLYPEDRTFAFTGDFLLKEISSNALIQRPAEGSHGYRSLMVYRASLRMVRQMAIRTALPGHGEIIRDVAGRIDELIDLMEQRKELVRRILDRGPKRPFSIVGAVFPELTGEHRFLGISEVIGHLEVLESEGAAFRMDDGYWAGTKGAG
ncbi:MAG: MBL fold metallo-hydrolase [Syntrophorhabdales bacterium]|jgi:glyoxylase-like metal-dependent hydrolase (beta-lactamase superfamily II)